MPRHLEHLDTRVKNMGEQSGGREPNYQGSVMQHDTCFLPINPTSHILKQYFENL